MRIRTGPTNLSAVAGSAVAFTMALGMAGTAQGQHAEAFESYSGSDAGVALNGQGAWYNPVTGSLSGNVYTYADNALGIPANPSGGGTNFVGSTGPGGGGVFSRSQLNIDLGATEAWTISFDIAVTFTGTLPTANNIGSLSTRSFAGGGDASGIIMLATWANFDTADTWNADMVWFNEAGTSITENVPDTGFQGLMAEHWYRWTLKVDSFSNRVLEVSIRDLESGAESIYNPTDRYMSGGAGGGHVPEGYRLFAGNTDIAGNTMCFDNVSITEIPAIGGCCLLDGTCLPDTPRPECEANPIFGSYGGNGSTCDQVICYEYGENGWILDAPIAFNGDSTQFEVLCGLGDSNDENFEIHIPYSGPWTISFCDTEWDTILEVGSAPCAADIATGDDECGVQSEVTVWLEEGSIVYANVYGFGVDDEGPYTIEISAPCVSEFEPVGDPEGEACGDDTNGGCNMDIPAFEPIAIGQTVAGTVWDDGGTRDTDWYEFTTLDGNLRWAFVGGVFDDDIITCDTGFNDYEVTISQSAAGADVTMTLRAESVAVFGMLADEAFNPTTDCATVAFISPAFFTDPCGGGEEVTGVIEEGSSSCEPSFGDTNGDGVVNVEDLLTVLGDWGCTGDCAGDTNCDEVTDVSDLLDVLGNWS